MRLTNYLFLIFSISVIFHLAGYQSAIPLFNTGEGVMNQSINGSKPIVLQTDLISSLGRIISTPEGLGLVGIIIGSAIVTTVLGGFGTVYIAPMIMLFFVLDLFAFPVFSLATDGLTSFLALPIVVLLNILGVLAVLSFVRGGGV
jgi:hypothetical protein